MCAQERCHARRFWRLAKCSLGTIQIFWRSVLATKRNPPVFYRGAPAHCSSDRWPGPLTALSSPGRCRRRRYKPLCSRSFVRSCRNSSRFGSFRSSRSSLSSSCFAPYRSSRSRLQFFLLWSKSLLAVALQFFLLCPIASHVRVAFLPAAVSAVHEWPRCEIAIPLTSACLNPPAGVPAQSTRLRHPRISTNTWRTSFHGRPPGELCIAGCDVPSRAGDSSVGDNGGSTICSTFGVAAAVPSGTATSDSGLKSGENFVVQRFVFGAAAGAS